MISFCNVAAKRIATGMGCKSFTENDTANLMIDKMASDPAWREDSIERAHTHAVRGGLAIIGIKEEPHGHVTVIYPAPMQESGTFGGMVPMVAHVGKPPNGIKKMSEAYLLSQKSGLRAFLWGETA